MGMDVYGIGNESAYFRANIWSWRPIHAIITEVASDFIPEKVLHGMQFNDGAGLTSDADCKKLAARISAWMEHNVEGKKMEVNSDSPDLKMAKMLESAFGADNISPNLSYEVDDEHLKEFVEFLNICDGFKVC